MKTRLKKKLAKKARASAANQLSSQSTPAASASLFATECWWIRKMLPEFAENRKFLVLQSSIERMISELAGIGIEIEDPEQCEFREGMTLRVALFEETTSLAAGKKMITETLEPAIYLNDRLVNQAKVIVSVGTGDK